MKPSILSLILSMLFYQPTFTQQYKSCNVHIFGQVNHFPAQTIDSVQLESKDLLSGESVYYYSKINKTGSFQIDFFTEKSTDVAMTYLHNQNRIFVCPDDTIQLQLDYNDCASSIGKHLISFTGKNAGISKDIFDFKIYFSSYRKNEDYFQNIKNILPDEYKNYRKKLKEEDLKILGNFVQIQNRSEKFRQWANDYFQYLCGVHLFAYPSLAAHLNQKNIDVPIPYYDFTRDYSLKLENNICNSAYVDYIQYYNSYLQDKLKGDIFTKFNPSFSEKISLIAEKSINISSSDKERLLSLKNKRFLELDTKDSAFCAKIFREFKDLIEEKKSDLFAQNNIKFYSSRMNGEILDLFLAIVLIKEIEAVNYNNAKALAKEYQKIANTAYLKEKVSVGYNSFEQRMNIIKFPAGVNINSITAKNGTEFLKKLTKKYSGNIIYIDFWATWCGPCRIEFGYAKDIKERFKTKPVVFVYLCGTSQEKVWKAVISELDLKGEHYFLDEKIQAGLYSKFNIASIPHYILINRKGKIVKPDAKRPSQSDELIKEVESQL